MIGVEAQFASQGLDRMALRRQIPAQLFELPLLATLLKVCFLIAVSAALMVVITRSDSVALMLPVSLLLGVVMFAFAGIGHDSGHLTASRNRVINDLTGVLTMSLVGMPARGWKVYHDIHHRHTGVLGVDTDAQYTVAQYVSMTPSHRRAMRWVCEHEYLFWPFGVFIIAGINWSYAVDIARRPEAHAPRVRFWNVVDMVVAAAAMGAAVAYGVAFGALHFFFVIAVPLGVAGLLAAATFTTHHRNLPPLTAAQARSVRHHFHLNTRTLTFPRWVPGNWFLAHVPWQIEHHLFPTVAGRKLALISPWVKAHARERGVPLQYEDYFRSVLDVARTRFAWGADGRLHRFSDIDRMLAAGAAPQTIPGYQRETRGVQRRDLRDLFGLR